MNRILERMRGKSATTKERVALFSALGLTALVSLVWVSSIGTNFSSPQAKETIASDVSPFKVLKENLSAAVARTESSLESISNKINKSEPTEAEARDNSISVDSEGVVVIGSEEKEQ